MSAAEEKALQLLRENPELSGAEIARRAGIEGSPGSQRKKVSRLREKLELLRLKHFPPVSDSWRGAVSVAESTGGFDPKHPERLYRQLERDEQQARAEQRSKREVPEVFAGGDNRHAVPPDWARGRGRWIRERIGWSSGDPHSPPAFKLRHVVEPTFGSEVEHAGTFSKAANSYTK